MLRIQIVLLLTISLLAGCGEVIVFGHTVREGRTSSIVNADPITATATPTPTTSASAAATTVSPAILRVKAVTLVLTPQAAEKIATDENFNAAALLDVIKSELQSRKVLDDSGSQVSYTAEISIDNYALRRTTNAIVFGYIINAGTLTGDIHVRDEYGNELQSRRIDAEARVSIPESGAAKNPLRPLYQQFAAATGDSLTGTPPKSVFGPDQHPR